MKKFPIYVLVERQILSVELHISSLEPSFHEILFVCRIETFFFLFSFLLLSSASLFIFKREKTGN